MNITTKSIYAIKVLSFLSKMEDENAVIGVQKISNTLDISMKYLEQIFSKLKKAGIVVSIRGANGGYHLNKSTKDIDILSIIEIMDGELTPTSCAKNKDCNKCENCAIFWLLDMMREKEENFLKSISINDLHKVQFPITNCRTRH